MLLWITKTTRDSCTFSVHLPLYEGFYPGENRGQAYRTKLRRHEAEPWRNQSRAPAELLCRGHFPPGGENHHHRHHQRSSHRGRVNLHQHLPQHHVLSNPSSSLVSNLVSKTTNWYLWFASSVDTPCSWCLLVYLVEDHMFRSLMHIITPLIMNMNMLCE